MKFSPWYFIAYFVVAISLSLSKVLYFVTLFYCDCARDGEGGRTERRWVRERKREAAANCDDSCQNGLKQKVHGAVSCYLSFQHYESLLIIRLFLGGFFPSSLWIPLAVNRALFVSFFYLLAFSLPPPQSYSCPSFDGSCSSENNLKWLQLHRACENPRYWGTRLGDMMCSARDLEGYEEASVKTITLAFWLAEHVGKEWHHLVTTDTWPPPNQPEMC